MSTEVIKRQPIRFIDDDNQKGFMGHEYFKFIIAQNDFTKFQLKTSPEANTPNTIGEDTFNTTGTWGFVPGTLTLLFPSGQVIGNNVVLENQLYEFVFTVSGLLAGSIQVFNGATLLDTIIIDGTYTFFIEGEATNDISWLASSDATIGLTISSFSIKEMPTNYSGGIYDTSNVFQTVIDDFVYKRTFATATFDWGSSALAFDTYKIGYIDEGNKIINANAGFDTTADWVLAAGGANTFDISNGQLNYVDTGGATSTATYPGILTIGKTYTIHWNLVAAAGSVAVEARAGTVAGTSRTVVGMFSETLVSDGVDFVFSFSSVGIPAVMSIESVTIKEVITPADETPDNFSQNVCYQDVEDRTLLMSWADLSDNFGFGYGDTNFIQILRTRGKITRFRGADQQYDTDQVGNQETKIFYFAERGINDLVLDAMPPFIHDVLHNARGHDGFFIDNVGYKWEPGDYLPDWNEDNDFEAYSIHEIHKTDQTPPKIRCASGEDPDATMPPSYILLEDGFKIVLEDDTGFLLKERQL